VNSPTSSRRNFLRSAVRYPLLAVLAVMGGRVIDRKPEAATACVIRPWCGGCDRFEGCLKPQAETARQQATVAASAGTAGQR
jgi:hypothetical protein